jgi:hypothetical protein
MVPKRGKIRAYFPIRQHLEAELPPGSSQLKDPPPLRPFYSWTDKELETHFERTGSGKALHEAFGRVVHLPQAEWPQWVEDAVRTKLKTGRLRFRSAEEKATFIAQANAKRQADERRQEAFERTSCTWPECLRAEGCTGTCHDVGFDLEALTPPLRALHDRFVAGFLG